jgi:hypothetical protein
MTYILVFLDGGAADDDRVATVGEESDDNTDDDATDESFAVNSSCVEWPGSERRDAVRPSREVALV